VQIGSLGPVVFQTSRSYVRNFQQLQERRRARYATHDVLNLEQKLQFLGLELAEVSLEMHFHHRFCRPRAELATLAGLIEAHRPHTLVVGGRPLGSFVVEELETLWRQVSARGELLSARARVRLKEYR